MSAASAVPTLSSLPERAFTLHCHGLRSPAIAQQLGVPERTVRAWITKVRDEVAASDTARMQEEFYRALEHLHQLTAAAWDAFEREQEQTRPLPSAHASSDTPNTPASSSAADAADAADMAHPPDASRSRPPDTPPAAPTTGNPRHGPRYLRLALDAQRQITRLLGLCDRDHPYPQASTPTLTSVPPSTPASHPESQIPAESATATTHVSPDARPQFAIPAKTATHSTPESRIPAESATAPSSLPPRPTVSFVASVLNPRPPTKTPSQTPSHTSRKARQKHRR